MLFSHQTKIILLALLSLMGIGLVIFQTAFASNERMVLGNTEDQYWIWVDENGEIKRDDQAFAKQVRPAFAPGIDTDELENTDINSSRTQSDEDTKKEATGDTEDSNQGILENNDILPEEEEEEEKQYETSVAIVNPINPDEVSFTRTWYDSDDNELYEEEKVYIQKPDGTLEYYKNTVLNPEDEKVQSQEYIFDENDLVSQYTLSTPNDGYISFSQQYLYEYDESSEVESMKRNIRDESGSVISTHKQVYEKGKEGEILTASTQTLDENGEAIEKAQYSYTYSDGEKVLSSFVSAGKDISGEENIIKTTYLYAPEEETSFFTTESYLSSGKSIQKEEFIYSQNVNGEKALQEAKKIKTDEKGEVESAFSSTYTVLESNKKKQRVSTLVTKDGEEKITQVATYQIDENGEEYSTQKHYTLTDSQGETIEWKEEIHTDPKSDTPTVTRIFIDDNGVDKAVSPLCFDF